MAIYSLNSGSYILHFPYWDEYGTDETSFGGQSLGISTNFFYAGASWEVGKGAAPIRSYLRFNLSNISNTITSATLNLFIGSDNPNIITYLNQVVSEIGPYGDSASAFYATNGTNIASITGTGWKQINVTNYANSHKGGYCDFGLIGSNESLLDKYDIIDRAINGPYLDITVEASAPKYYIQQKSNYFNRRRSA